MTAAEIRLCHDGRQRRMFGVWSHYPFELPFQHHEAFNLKTVILDETVTTTLFKFELLL